MKKAILIILIFGIFTCFFSQAKAQAPAGGNRTKYSLKMERKFNKRKHTGYRPFRNRKGILNDPRVRRAMKYRF